MNNPDRPLPEEIAETDILFDCPKCGKSLVIQEQGAGLVVTCPDCDERMQVPVPERIQQELEGSPGQTTLADYTAAEESAPAETEVLRARVERLEVTMEEVQQRKRLLEKMRIDHAMRFERFREEMALIQAALDRMTDLLQDYTKSP
jgi:uncharacterized Zn finger protein (UPF0148 family)